MKALQSVGQIIAEVLKQLDDERCPFVFLLYLLYLICILCLYCLYSHCQVVVGAAVRRRVPAEAVAAAATWAETAAGLPRLTRYDDADDYASHPVFVSMVFDI